MSRPLSPDDVFTLNPKIRWTALSTQDGTVLFCQMRPGMTSYTPTTDDNAFMEFGPQLIAGIAERLSLTGGAGKLRSIIVNLEKDSVLITQVDDGYLAISVDRAEAFDILKQIEPSLRQLYHGPRDRA